MAARITPCRERVTERFPLLSFVVEVEPDRPFEIVCTTDAQLLSPAHEHMRTPENFFSTGMRGLLRAPAGRATYMLPPEVMSGFAGASRLHYALATYGNAGGSDIALTVPPARFAEAPSVQLARDFTGRTLGARLPRREAASKGARYGAGAPRLGWGGDRVSERPESGATAQSAYHDGYDDALWARAPRGAALGRGGATSRTASGGLSLDVEPPGYGDAAELRAGGVTPRPLAPFTPPSQQPIPLSPPQGMPQGLFGGRAPSPITSHGARYGGAAATPSVEPPGYEDAPALALAGVAPIPLSAPQPVSAPQPGRAPRAPAVAATAYGGRGEHAYGGRGEYEDARDRARRLGGPLAPDAPSAEPRGREEGYSADDGGELPLALSRALSGPGSAPPVPLTIPEKFRIVRIVAQAESGSDGYSAINADTEFNDPSNTTHYQKKHVGLSWGLVQFTQRHGALGKVLSACARRDPARFSAVFGPSAETLLSVVTASDEEARLAPVDGALLWEEPWLSRFRAAGAEPAFQAAQNEIAIVDYLDPQLPFCRALGLDTDRAIAMVYDRSVHRGVGGARRFVAEAVIPIRTQADRDTALSALGLDIRGLQQLGGVPVDGVWGPRTAAAAVEQLRALPSSPIAIPSRDEMLRLLVKAATGTRAEKRLTRLSTSSELSDVVYRIS